MWAQFPYDAMTKWFYTAIQRQYFFIYMHSTLIHQLVRMLGFCLVHNLYFSLGLLAQYHVWSHEVHVYSFYMVLLSKQYSLKYQNVSQLATAIKSDTAVTMNSER